MPTRVTLYAAVLVLSGTAVAVPAVVTVEGPPPGFTGGFGEPSCVACHLGSEVNAFGGRVVVEGLPAAYAPGAEYILTVLLEAEETQAAGFQITSRFTGGAGWGRNAGRLEPIDARVAVTDSAGVSYVHQSLEGSRTHTSDGSSWSVVWVAPSAGGPVTISVAANSGNADNSPLSDLVYTAEVIVPPNR